MIYYIRTRFQTLLIVTLAFLAAHPLSAQVSCVPLFPNTDSDVTITFHANEGNGALNNFAGPIYAHMGVITSQSSSPSDWKYVQTQWGVADPDGLMTNAGPNTWTKSFNIRTFFGVPANETVLRLAFVFRNQSGSTVGRAADGGDIFYDVYPNDGQLRTRFLQPTAEGFLTTLGANIPVKAIASASGNLKLIDNGVEVASATGDQLQTNITASGNFHLVQFVANAGSQTDTSSFLYVIPATLPAQNPPAGTELGINHLDPQTVRLSLYAPGKQNIYVLGDFNNWLPIPSAQMTRSLDGNRWWIDIPNLSPGVQYRFQYLVDGNLKIADPLSTLVLDPWNDAFIDQTTTFPNMPAYPAGKTTGIVSVFETAPTPFNWQAVNYQRPDKTKLTIYELLMRDFLAKNDYATLLDTLDYLQRLGVNAIELMPVSEFDGNISWGYNPSFHKALDKYYGDPNSFKTLIDACHQRGMAVIVDVVFNQATDDSPLARLYWDAANNRPAPNNPWLNPTATHPFNVFRDFNHQSPATKEYMKNCLKHWIQEYRIDGFRYDLSKGFTQTNSGSNVGQWGQYDASRVAIWKDYADFVWSVDPDNYVILEHFADNSEEKELANYGMMLWGKMWGEYKDIALGYTSGINTSLANINYKNRQWNDPHLVAYMESHDEDRIVYECKTYGLTSGNYNVKSLPTALRRVEALSNLFYTVPGPKMLWQFGEVGYDFHINLCEDGVTINNDCRTSPKPIRWDYYQDPARRRLYDVTRSLLHLRNNYEVFHTDNYTLNLGGGAIRSIILNGSDIDVVVVANVGVTSATASVSFPNTGTWYEYYSGATLNVGSTGSTALGLLSPGAYRLYTSQLVPLPDGVVVSTDETPVMGLEQVRLSPNPTGDACLLRFSTTEAGTVGAAILDIHGKQVRTLTEKELPSGDHQWMIDLSDQAPGVYLVQLYNHLGGVSTQKVVKQ